MLSDTPQTTRILLCDDSPVERLALAQEAARTDAQQAHEERMAGREHAHAHMTQRVDQAHEAALTDMEHEHTMQEQEQAADLAPEPATEPESEPTN